MNYKISHLTSIYQWLLILLFLLILTAPMIGHMGKFFTTDYIKTNEQRNPHQFPEFPNQFKISKTFLHDLDLYFNDHFGFRQIFISTYNFLKVRMGVSPLKKVILGKKGWLFLNADNPIEQYRGMMPFSKAEVIDWVNATQRAWEWLDSHNIPFIVAIAPNKSSIYPEYLPDWVVKVSPATPLDQLSEAFLQRQHLDFIDLRPHLLNSKKQYPVFWMTDSHWNFHGSYDAYQVVMSSVKKYFPNIEIVNRENIQIDFVTGNGRDLAKLLNLSHVVQEPYEEKFQFINKSYTTEYLPRKPKATSFEVKSENDNAPRAIIFGDSFTIWMESFFNQTFSKILYSQYTDYVQNSSLLKTDLIEDFNPDIVILIVVERIMRTFSPTLRTAKLLSIENWGPKKIKQGHYFNKQSNGQSALWIVGTKLSNDTVIVWNDVPLVTAFNKKNPYVNTALVSKNLYAGKGIYSIFIKNNKKGEISNKVNFEVY